MSYGRHIGNQKIAISQQLFNRLWRNFVHLVTYRVAELSLLFYDVFQKIKCIINPNTQFSSLRKTSAAAILVSKNAISDLCDLCIGPIYMHTKFGANRSRNCRDMPFYIFFFNMAVAAILNFQIVLFWTTMTLVLFICISIINLVQIGRELAKILPFVYFPIWWPPPSWNRKVLFWTTCHPFIEHIYQHTIFGWFWGFCPLKLRRHHFNPKRNAVPSEPRIVSYCAWKSVQTSCL